MDLESDTDCTVYPNPGKSSPPFCCNHAFSFELSRKCAFGAFIIEAGIWHFVEAK